MNSSYINSFKDWHEERNQGQEEFLQAVAEVIDDVAPLVSEDCEKHAILERLTSPERIISFRVTWEDDGGVIHVNRGYRVQHSGDIGPYKGGLRFHPTVSESILKFLAFEQTFKNALTGLPMGGAKGGSDFDPRGRSDKEIMRFCQAFMNELYRHIGENTDIPAGDINVGSREIGYLFGQYRRLSNTFSGSLTGKDIEFGGSHVRLQATGFGLVYFVNAALKELGKEIKQQRIGISGVGNVALHTALKAVELGADVITLSSSKGCAYFKNGLSEEGVKRALASDASSLEKLKDLVEQENGEWYEGEKPWKQKMDIALPCATQNELDEDDAKALLERETCLIAEGANMPCTPEALHCFEEAKVIHVPGKASNAGGVALSGLEMSQNASFSRWEADDLDSRLKSIMEQIHKQCLLEAPRDGDFIHYRKGANMAAYKIVSHALYAQGVG
jgi:glutamate dehydrogenase (NADP+)